MPRLVRSCRLPPPCFESSFLPLPLRPLCGDSSFLPPSLPPSSPAHCPSSICPLNPAALVEFIFIWYNCKMHAHLVHNVRQPLPRKSSYEESSEKLSSLDLSIRRLNPSAYLIKLSMVVASLYHPRKGSARLATTAPNFVFQLRNAKAHKWFPWRVNSCLWIQPVRRKCNWMVIVISMPKTSLYVRCMSILARIRSIYLSFLYLPSFCSPVTTFPFIFLSLFHFHIFLYTLLSTAYLV